MIVKVKNLNNTGDNNPPSGFDSWLDWWEDKKCRLARKCSNTNCNGDAEVGAHVKYVDYNNQWFITPLCKKCNNMSSDIEFSVSTNDLEPINND